MSTFTVMSHFCITRNFWALLSRMATCLTSMLTCFSWFLASLCTPFFHHKDDWATWLNDKLGAMDEQLEFKNSSLPHLQVFLIGSKHGGQLPK